MCAEFRKSAKILYGIPFSLLFLPLFSYLHIIPAHGDLVLASYTKRFEEQVTGTFPKNSNWFEFVGLDFEAKMGHLH